MISIKKQKDTQEIILLSRIIIPLGIMWKSNTFHYFTYYFVLLYPLT